MTIAVDLGCKATKQTDHLDIAIAVDRDVKPQTKQAKTIFL